MSCEHARVAVDRKTKFYDNLRMGAHCSHPAVCLDCGDDDLRVYVGFKRLMDELGVDRGDYRYTDGADDTVLRSKE